MPLRMGGLVYTAPSFVDPRRGSTITRRLTDDILRMSSNYIQVYPPSTGRFTPVTYDDAGDARKMAAESSSPSFP